MRYTTVIGLEVHVQLLTRSKLFSGSISRFNPDQPNTQTDPVTLGLPGTLPVMNRGAIRLALQTALALNCNISRFTKWDRKQYFYPDLPKGYQISQYDMPLGYDGFLEIELDPETEETKRVQIIRAHLEEDAGKSLHDESGGGGESRIDLNRTGTPLMEIVSEPDLRSPAEARLYLEELRLLLTYLGVSDCNMQEGSLRCDANVNLHVDTDDGHRVETPIVEVKNMNTFRGVEAALVHEAERQFEEWQRTGHKLGDIPKETRGWDAERGITFTQRSKEEAPDYRYFPDPDLVPVVVSEDWIEETRGGLCEFPADRRRRFRDGYLLSNYDAAVIVDQGKLFADYFEEVAGKCGDGKQAANWVTQYVLRDLNEQGLSIDDFPVPADVLGALLGKVVEEEITVKSAREVFAELKEADPQEITADRIEQIIEEKDLALVTDTGALEQAVTQVIENNPQAVADFQNGKQAAVGPLIGQVMKVVKGADAKQVREMLMDRMSS